MDVPIGREANVSCGVLRWPMGCWAVGGLGAENEVPFLTGQHA